MDFHKDYYKILGVERNANASEIKASYKQLAKQYHPDRNNSHLAAEEQFKLINEAYQILGNRIKKDVYDRYWTYANEFRRKERKEKFSLGNFVITKKEVRQQKELKAFFRGSLIAKYWAELTEDQLFYNLKETSYKIHPTEVEIYIDGDEIYTEDELPPAFQKAYASSEQFLLPLSQPIKCIIKYGDKQEAYELDIKELLYTHSEILDSTKFENQSLGTLKAEVFGYILKLNDETTVEEELTYVGETGNFQQKESANAEYVKREYFHVDGTTFWSGWEKQPSIKTSTARRRGRKYGNTDVDLWWIFPAIVLLVVFIQMLLYAPQALLVIFLIVVGCYLIGLLLVHADKIPFRLSFLSILTVLFFANRGCVSFDTIPKLESTKGYDSLHTQRDTVVTLEDGQNVFDEEITHYLRWRDYSSRPFEGKFSILQSNLVKSNEFHSGLHIPIRTEKDVSQVYSSLSNNDTGLLTKVYSEFEIIRSNNGLNQREFADMVVSCIQSIPYSLVLDTECNPNLYSGDEFISEMIKQCNDSCCVGNRAYGVNSPVEFWRNLKGDCDTRSLLLFNILEHFGYDVAILVSSYYKHAILAVAFEESENKGLTVRINGKEFSCWETTNKGFRAGEIRHEYSDLRFWNLALISQKS